MELFNVDDLVENCNLSILFGLHENLTKKRDELINEYSKDNLSIDIENTLLEDIDIVNKNIEFVLLAAEIKSIDIFSYDIIGEYCLN